MEAKKYVGEFWNILRENNVLKLVLLSFIVVLFIEGMFVIKAMHTQRTIVIPCVRGKYEFTDTQVSPKYLINMGIFLADLVENFTPKTIEYNYNRFLSFFTPENFGRAQSVLMANAERYISNNVSSMFSATDVKLFPGKIVVYGVRKLAISDKIVSTERLAISIYYTIKNGEFEVISYEEKHKKSD